MRGGSLFKKYKGKQTKQKKRKQKGGNKTHKKQTPYNKAACSPLVSPKDKIDNTSCLTKPILLRLKQEFNKDHPDSPILFDKPILIWRELKSRLDECTDDRCLLKEIDDKAARNTALNALFAPEHPPSWLKNKNEWLSNYDIDAVMKQYEQKYKDFEYLGTTAIDYDFKYSDGHCVEDDLCKFDLASLLKNGKKKYAAVFNLDKHDERGSHWVSLFVSVPEKTIMFFDSANGGIPPEIDRLQKTIVQQGQQHNPPISFVFKTNKKDHQMGNTECGVYSIYFITEMLRDFNAIQQFLHGNISDKKMEEERLRFFNKPMSK